MLTILELVLDLLDVWGWLHHARGKRDERSIDRIANRSHPATR